MYSPDTTKYLIHLILQIEGGVVDKPDVVGAIFGQTEGGLLGEDLDLRDLQRTGRVGRIDVQITTKRGETKGEILISSSLDRAETALLASSLETIDRVGPCTAHVKVDRIEDIRVTKRRRIVERAKELLLEDFDEGSINSDELLDEVRETIRIEKLEYLGEEKVHAGGPNVMDSDAIILVEGAGRRHQPAPLRDQERRCGRRNQRPTHHRRSLFAEDRDDPARRRPGGRRTDPSRAPPGRRDRLCGLQSPRKERRGDEPQRDRQGAPEQGARSGGGYRPASRRREERGGGCTRSPRRDSGSHRCGRERAVAAP